MAVSTSVPLGYQPALDGLRALSILAVMLRHTGLLSGGFLGVDIFFALSGFLITTLLLHEYDASGRVSLRDFYARRALRLLPALGPIVVIAGGAMLAWMPAWPKVMFVVSVVFYTANWAGIAMLPQGLLGHVWSLSIEEQFYVVWPPALLLLLSAVHRRRRLTILVAGAAIVAFVYRLMLLKTGATLRRVYLGSDAHADPILIGCALALFISSPAYRPGPRTERIWTALGVPALGVLLTILTFAEFPQSYLVHGMSSGVALAAALVILAVLQPSSRLRTMLEAAPLVWVGRRSYGLYLWHFPVLYLADALWVPGLPVAPGAASVAWVATFAIAAASFRYIEQPALALKTRFRPEAVDRLSISTPSSSARPLSFT